MHQGQTGEGSMAEVDKKRGCERDLAGNRGIFFVLRKKTIFLDDRIGVQLYTDLLVVQFPNGTEPDAMGRRPFFHPRT
jgi:hypothetical protein